MGVWCAVIVHPYFYRLPWDQRLAILLHEQAHLELKHCRARWWWFFSGLWWRDPACLSQLLMQQEFDADAYVAARGLGESLAAFLLRSNDRASKVRPSSIQRVQRLQAQL